MGIKNSIAYSIIPVTGGKGHNQEYFKHELPTLSKDILFSDALSENYSRL